MENEKIVNAVKSTFIEGQILICAFDGEGKIYQVVVNDLVKAIIKKILVNQEGKLVVIEKPIEGVVIAMGESNKKE